MGGGEIPKIPDYKIYKVEGIPELELVQRLLAARGLKDPWLRNEAWRYSPKIHTSLNQSFLRSIGRGFKWAVAAMAITIIADKVYHKANPGSGGHH